MQTFWHTIPTIYHRVDIKKIIRLNVAKVMTKCQN